MNEIDEFPEDEADNMESKGGRFEYYNRVFTHKNIEKLNLNNYPMNFQTELPKEWQKKQPVSSQIVAGI